MPAKSKRIALPGSSKSALPGARAVGPVPGDERFEVTVRLRPKTPLDPLPAGPVGGDVLPKDRHYLTRQELADRHGADPADIGKVTAFAQAQGLVVVQVSPEQRSLVLSGSAAAFSQAFGTRLQQYEHPGGMFRGRTGELTQPADLRLAVRQRPV